MTAISKRPGIIDDCTGFPGAGDYNRMPDLPLKTVLPSRYKFSEDKILQEVQKHIDKTYFSHYSKGKDKVQTTELIASDPKRGLHFCLGNVMKYADRAEFKGSTRQDLLKAAHYIVMAIDCFDRTEEEKNETQ